MLLIDSTTCVSFIIDTIDYVTGIGNLQFIAYDDNFAGSARVTFGARVAIDTNKAYVVSNILLRCCVGLRAPFFLGGDSPRRVPVCFEKKYHRDSSFSYAQTLGVLQVRLFKVVGVGLVEVGHLRFVDLSTLLIASFFSQMMCCIWSILLRRYYIYD